MANNKLATNSDDDNNVCKGTILPQHIVLKKNLYELIKAVNMSLLENITIKYGIVYRSQ